MIGTKCNGYERQHNGRFVQSVQCGSDHCCALTGSTAEQIDGDRELECWGPTGHDQIPSLSNDFVVQDFAASRRGTCVLSTDRMVICFGSIMGSLGQFELSQSFTASGARLAHSQGGMSHLCAYDETNVLILQCMLITLFFKLPTIVCVDMFTKKCLQSFLKFSMLHILRLGSEYVWTIGIRRSDQPWYRFGGQR